jgi:hypothetical protein
MKELELEDTDAVLSVCGVKHLSCAGRMPSLTCRILFPQLERNNAEIDVCAINTWLSTGAEGELQCWLCMPCSGNHEPHIACWFRDAKPSPCVECQFALPAHAFKFVGGN